MSAYASVSPWSSFTSVAEPTNGNNFDEYVWMVVCASLAGFFMAWGIGANDVSTSFATSVGSRTLKLWQAVVIAAVFKFAGAVGLGGTTAKTVVSDISNVKLYTAVPEIYMYGMLCALTVAGVWLLFATYFRMAVSTTHSIIGSIMGFSLVFGGFQDGVLWSQETGSFPYSKGFLSIVLSWFFSPIIGGILSALFFLFSCTLVLRRENSTSKAIFMLSVLLFFTFFINLMFVLAKGAKSKMSKTWQCVTDKGRRDLSGSNCDALNTAAVWIAACAGVGISIFGGAFGIWFLRRKFTHEELTK
jgi:sodium-dependent phosphate transporter